MKESTSPGPTPKSLTEGYAVRLYPIDEGDDIRLADLWRVVWDGRWLILSLAVIGAVVTTLAGFLVTPIYRTEVLMAPVTSERSGGGLAGLAGQFGGLAALAGVNIGSDDTSAESLAILSSRAFTERFIEKNNLMPHLFPDAWDAEKGRWKSEDPAEIPNKWLAFELFDKSIRGVSQDSETRLVTLTIDWVDPEVARDWANGLVSDVNAAVRSRAIDQSNRSIEYLRKQLQETTEVELRDAVVGLMEIEMKKAMLSTVRTEFAFEVIDPAVAPEKRRWPNRALIAVLGFAAGLMGGVVWAFVRRAINA